MLRRTEMTIRHLKIFITVYQKKSITEAAAELNMTQPTVTRAIQEMEEHYSVQLFERIRHRLYDTEAGKKLYRQAVHVVSSIDQMEKDMTEWDEAGSLRIGSGTTLGCTLLPRILTEFQSSHPKTAVHSYITNKTRLQEMLLHNEIDFALIEGAPDDQNLEKIVIGRDHMVLILPSAHPLCRKKNISIEDLKDYPIVISEEGTASRTFLEHLFSIHGLNLRPVMESGSIPALIEAVDAGIGISLMPQKLVSLYSKQNTITERKLSYEVLIRDNHLIWYKSKYLAKTSEDFIETVKECSSSVLE